MNKIGLAKHSLELLKHSRWGRNVCLAAETQHICASWNQGVMLMLLVFTLLVSMMMFSLDH